MVAMSSGWPTRPTGISAARSCIARPDWAVTLCSRGRETRLRRESGETLSGAPNPVERRGLVGLRSCAGQRCQSAAEEIANAIHLPASCSCGTVFASPEPAPRPAIGSRRLLIGKSGLQPGPDECSLILEGLVLGTVAVPGPVPTCLRTTGPFAAGFAPCSATCRFVTGSLIGKRCSESGSRRVGVHMRALRTGNEPVAPRPAPRPEPLCALPASSAEPADSSGLSEPVSVPAPVAVPVLRETQSHSVTHGARSNGQGTRMNTGETVCPSVMA